MKHLTDPNTFFISFFNPISGYAFLLIIGCIMLFCSGQNRSCSCSVVAVDTFIVASYNVENLFDLNRDGTEFSSYIPYESNWNQETHAVKLDNISSVCAAMSADILVLVEVENKTAAQQLQKALRRKKHRYPYLAIGEEPNPTTTCQAILSRYPIKNVQGHGIPKKGNHYTRNILEADIVLGDAILKIFAVHLPSKRFPESYRLAAGSVLTKRLQQLPAGTEYLIAGDFNSNYNEAETFYTERLDDTNGKTTINHQLNTVRSPPGQWLDFVTERELVASTDNRYHYNLWLELPENRRYSYRYHGQYNTLDHILLPRQLYDATGLSYVDNSFSVFTWQGRLLYDGVPFRWKMAYGKKGRYHVGEGYSDHLPITAKFIVGPFKFIDTANNTAVSRPFPGYNSFETGYEGWLPGSKRFHLTRDTVAAAHERYCLRIDGRAKRSTTAVYCRIPLNRLSTGVPETLRFSIRGKGRFAIRVRVDYGKWYCYTGNSFSRTIKNTRYTDFSSSQWRDLQLQLPIIPSDAESLEVQLRAAGHEDLCVWVDNMEITG